LTGAPFQFEAAPFYFLRHGETNDTERGIVQGQRETELNDEGRRTAHKAARLLSPLRLGSIYSSPLRRARETAEIISAMTGVPVTPLPGLMERNWGAYQGKSRDARPQLRDPTGVERSDDFASRVLEAMTSISGASPVLVVAHSGVFRVLCGHAGQPVDRRDEVENGLVFKFDPPAQQGQRWRVEVVAA
jgi:probable phosphoglycerate mutase